MRGKTAVGCSNFKECGFKLPFELLGKKLTDKQLTDLVLKKKTAKIKGLQKGDGSEAFDAALILTDDWNIELK
jgi:DNA topoisomerase-3